MALVPAICTQCGAQIEVDDTHEAGICKFCGTAFITEKVINNYSITNNINASVVNIIHNTPINDFETDGHKLLAYKGNESIVNIPSHINEIADKAFEGNLSIVEINFLGNVTSIGNYAFARCRNLVTVNMQEGLYSIGNCAFVCCEKLEHICLPNSICYIGGSAFMNCENIKSIELPQELKVLQPYVFSNCYNLKEVTLKRELKTLESEIFTNSKNIKKIVIPASVTRLNGYVFMNMNLDKVVFENADNIQRLDSPIFNGCTKVPEIEASNAFKEKNHDMLYTTKSMIENMTIKNTKTSNGCYIATSVYGSYDCPEVWTLRRFRDYTLDTTWYGRLFIKGYYAISPTIVKWFGETKWFQSFWKARLDKMVSELNSNGVENTRYQDKY